MNRRKTSWNRVALAAVEARERRAVADNEVQLRDKIDHELPILIQRFQKSVSPAGQFGIASDEQGPRSALKGLRQSRIGNVALVLVELAPGEQASRRNEHPVQLIDDRGLADARVP